MNKLLISLITCAFSLAMSGTVIAADSTYPDKTSSPQSTQSDPQAAPKDEPASVAKDQKNKPDDVSDTYLSELKKCDALKGSEKQSCEDKVRGQHGKM